MPLTRFPPRRHALVLAFALAVLLPTGCSSGGSTTAPGPSTAEPSPAPVAPDKAGCIGRIAQVDGKDYAVIDCEIFPEIVPDGADDRVISCDVLSYNPDYRNWEGRGFNFTVPEGYPGRTEPPYFGFYLTYSYVQEGVMYLYGWELLSNSPRGF
ncbi:MAG: hypothetical protein LBC97_09515 [Bifidobacteriaceae bacterium]|jgi:hypothetical protein|nr:hypothetical protein [Bifidobacteriaceae bacterium]